MRHQKRYLGDSVYAIEDDYGAIILTTENGIGASNEITLEDETIKSLERFLADRAKRLGNLIERRTNAQPK